MPNANSGSVKIVSKDPSLKTTDPTNVLKVNKVNTTVIVDSPLQTIRITQPGNLRLIDSSKKGTNPYFDESIDTTSITGIAVLRGLIRVDLSWIELTLSDNHRHTEVWRSLLDDVDSAKCVGTSTTQQLTDTVDPQFAYYYWFRAVSFKGNYGLFYGSHSVSSSTDKEALKTFLELNQLYTLVSELDGRLSTSIANSDTATASEISDMLIDVTTLVNEAIADLTNSYVESTTALGEATSSALSAMQLTLTDNADAGTALAQTVSTLSARVDSEGVTRSAAIDEVNLAYTNLSNSLASSIETIEVAIADEVALLDASITTERAARIADGVATATSIESVNSAIANEVSNRVADVDTERSARITNESATATLVSSISAGFVSSEDALNSRIDSTNTALSSAEGAFASIESDLTASMNGFNTAQSSRTELVEVDVLGNSLSITELDNSVTSISGDTATALFQLSAVNDTLDDISATARMGVDVNGNFTGVFIEGGLTASNLTFTGSEFSLYDPALGYNALEYTGGAWRFTGTLILSDGTNVETVEDIKGETGAGWWRSIADAEANGRTPVNNDIAINGGVAVRYNESNSTWETASAFLTGPLIVDDTIISRHIATGSVTANKIDVDDLFAKTITARGSIKYSNNGKYAALGGTSLFELNNSDGPVLKVSNEGVFSFDAEFVNPGSIPLNALSSDEIERILSFSGASAPDTGGTASSTFSIFNSTSYSPVITIGKHGTNNVALTLTASFSDTVASYPASTIEFVFDIQRSINGGTFSPINTQTVTANVTIDGNEISEEPETYNIDISPNSNGKKTSTDMGGTEGQSIAYKVVVTSAHSIFSSNPVRCSISASEAAAGGSGGSEANNPTITIATNDGIDGGGTFTLNQTGNQTFTIGHGSLAESTSLGSGVSVIGQLGYDLNGHVKSASIRNLANDFLGLTARAADADLLDGIQASGFAQLNANNTFNKSIEVLGIPQGNNTVGTDRVRLNGYGMLGNRGALYLTNSGSVIIGNGGIHAQNNGLTVTTTSITAGSGRVFVGNLTGTASDSSLLTGSAKDVGAVGGTIALRDGSADINVRLVRSNYTNQGTCTGAMAFRNSTSDNYIRFCNDPAAIRGFLGAAGTNTIITSTGLARTLPQNGHLVGSYNNVGPNASNSNPIYTIGSSYNPSSTALGNMYGIGFCSTSAAFLNSTDLGRDPTSGWGAYFASDGNARIYLNAGNGDGYFKGTIYAQGATFRSGIFATEVTETSALKYKDITERVDPQVSLNKVVEIGKKGTAIGTLKDDETKKVHRWFIADEVNEVMPEVVKLKDGEVDGLSYSRMLPDAYAAIAKQQEIIEALMVRVTELEGKI
jgi:hypothetical protein